MSLSPTFTHSAFRYDTDDDYVATLVPYLCAALTRGHGAAVAASRARAGLLRDALGDAAAGVLFLPDDEWYVRPGRTIAGWTRVLAASAARGRPVTRLVGEVRFGGPAAHPHWIRYESAVTAALAGAAAELLCPYDGRALPPAVLASAPRTHPCLYAGKPVPNPGFVAPETLLREVPEPAVATPGEPTVELPTDGSVAGLRERLRAHARHGGWLPEHRLEELVLAVSEVATNSIRHGGPLRRLAFWVTDRTVACEVADDGGNPPGPLAGYLPPAPGVAGGMGMWLVRQVCDAVQITADGGVTRVRFAVDR